MSLEDARVTAEEAAARLLEQIEEFKPRLSARLQRVAAGLSSSGGRIASTPENMALIAVLIAAMQEQFLDEELVDAIADYIEAFDVVAQEVIDAFDGFDDLDPEMIQAIDRTYKQQTVGILTSPDTYNSGMFQSVANAMITAIAIGSTVEQVLSGVEQVVLSDALTADTQTLVESAPLLMQRAATAQAAEAVGAEFFLYQGRPIKTTREFCAEREGRYWHIEEIRQWGRNAAGGNGWPGVVDGTNAQTIFIHLGGWYGGRNSCRHVLIPVTIDRVPEDDRERMRAKGLIP